MGKRKTRVQPQKETVMTKDSFQNALTRLGFGMPNLLEGTSYPMVRLTQDYTLLNSLYRNHWIIRKIVDVIPEDMCKNWIKLKTQVEPGQISAMEKVLRKTKTKSRILEGLKWGRLYGGAAGLILLDGESGYLAEPLDYRFILPGSYKGLLILDRWSGISPEAELVGDITSPDFGLPKYYQITLNDGRMLRVHHSRIIRFMGNALPLWESWAEQQWGASVVESVYEELKKRDNTSFNIANLVFLANLRIYKTSMTDLLSLGDSKLQQDFYNMMQQINWMMNNSGMTIIGKEDEFDSKQYTFTGLNDVYESFMLDIAGACEIPVTRLFGRSPAGFNATGESDLTNYYDSIEEKQEAYLVPILDKLLPVIALSAWGMVPDDLDYEFNPLRKADPKENADLAKSMAESVVSVYNANLISQQIALKELRQQSEQTGMWSNITDEDIANADTGIDFGGELADLSALGFIGDAHWKEEDHPRRKDGTFGTGGGKAETGSEVPLTVAEEQAVKTYISSGSYILNEKLRNGQALFAQEQQFMEAMDTMLDKMPTFQGNVIRSLQFPSSSAREKFLKEHREGATIVYKAYTSADKQEVHNRDGDVQIYIKSISAGKDLSGINALESEVVFPRNTAFEIIRIVEQEGQTVMLLKEVITHGKGTK